MHPNTEAKCLRCVVQSELDDISTRRSARGQTPIAEDDHWERRADAAGLFGICISGGGIRSATFGLGVLQGLQEKGLLESADYLSTVSGGGYIGSWLQGVLDRLKGFDALDPGKPEHPGVRFLRKYSNYLAPRPGLSLDSVVIPVIWTRNAGLNQTILIAATLTAIIVCLLAGYAANSALGLSNAWLGYTLSFLVTALTVRFVGRNLKDVVRSEFSRKTYEDHSSAPDEVGYWVVIPMLVAAWLLVIGLSKSDSLWGWPMFVALFGLHVALQYCGGFVQCYAEQHCTGKAVPWVGWVHTFWIPVVCGAVDFGLLRAIALLVRFWSGDLTQGVYEALSWGPPLALLAIFVGTGLQIGLMGKDYPDAAREWLARAGSWIFICAAGWAAVFSVAVFAPYWIILLWGWHKASILSAAGGWITTTAAGVFAGKSSSTGNADGKKNSINVDAIARYAPWIALPGFFILISFAAHMALYVIYLQAHKPADLTWCCFIGEMKDLYWRVLAFQDPGQALVLVGAAVVIFLVLSVRVNINEFTLHHFYKNRLVRCYLGASADAGKDGSIARRDRVRMPNKFTGFDPKDDILLADLVSSKDKPRQAPYPIINATLTVTQGTELATQDRKAKSWIFTPRFSGFLPEGTEADRRAANELSLNGYVETKKLLGGDLHLGTAMAISGAALSPAQGYHTSTQVAFLMTLFDVRLGWWIGNPRNGDKWTRPGPQVALWPLLRELFGSMDERSPYLNLSDGGNFENLGLYELVRRRCRYIVAIDAEEDPQYQFSALGGAVRKCRIDFGAEIDIHPRMIRPQGEFSDKHWTVGTIHYRDLAEPGYLLYIKASVTGGEPEDVEQYRRDFPVFPQQPTLDQFFSEAQFESYRRLGLECSRSAFANIGAAGSLENIFTELLKRANHKESHENDDFETRLNRAADRLPGREGIWTNDQQGSDRRDRSIVEQ